MRGSEPGMASRLQSERPVRRVVELGARPLRPASLVKVLFWILLAALCLSIGVYPLMYLFASGKIGLLQTKSDALLSNGWWRLGFYAHIVCGGVALSVGWTQFLKSWRLRP